MSGVFVKIEKLVILRFEKLKKSVLENQILDFYQRYYHWIDNMKKEYVLIGVCLPKLRTSSSGHPT